MGRTLRGSQRNKRNTKTLKEQRQKRRLKRNCRILIEDKQYNKGKQEYHDE